MKKITFTIILIFTTFLFANFQELIVDNTSNSSLSYDYVNVLAIDNVKNKRIGTWGRVITKFDGMNWTLYNKTNSDLAPEHIKIITVDNMSNELAFSQQTKFQTLQTMKMITNESLGFSFKTMGEVKIEDSTTYSIKLSTLSELNEPPPHVYVSVSSEPFVYLPGSYGGRYFLNRNAQAGLLTGRLLIDTITVNELMFKREYWIVYAGMGVWETVINCYTLKKGRYYIVSLVQEVQSGKPGEVIGKKKLTKEEIQSSLLHMMRNSTNPTVIQFNQILHSFLVN